MPATGVSKRQTTEDGHIISVHSSQVEQKQPLKSLALKHQRGFLPEVLLTVSRVIA
jgi:hypothetical protein